MKLVKASDLTEKQKKQIEENRIAEENRIKAIREERQQREQRRKDAQAMSGGSGLLNRAREYNQENRTILPTRNNSNYLGHVDNVQNNGKRKIAFQDAYITNARKERESYVKPVQDEISSEIRNYYTVSLGDEKKKKEKVNKVSDSSELAHFQKKLAIQEMANDPNQYWKYKDYIDEQLHNFRKEDAIKEGQRQAEETNRGMKEGKYVSTITQYLGNQFGQGVEGFGMGLSNALDMGFAGANKLIDKDSKIGDTFLTSDKRKSEIKQLKDYYSQDIEDKGLQFAGKVSNQIGNQIPSMALNVLAPGSGLYALGTSAGGRKAIETLNDDNSNYLQALATGTIVGGTEYLTERMFSGNALTRGLNATPLDEMASNAVSKVGNPFLRRLAGLGMDVAGENIEELVSNVVERGTDALINGKDFGSLNELLSEGGETLATTTATTMVLAMLGLGGETYNEANQIRANRDAYNQSVKNANLDVNNQSIKSLFNSANNKELTPMFSSEIFENSNDSYKVVEMSDGSKILAINPNANITEVNEQIRKMSNKQLEQITTPMDEDIAEGIRRTAENNYLKEQENRTSLENSARNYSTSLSNQDMQNIQEVQNRLADRGIKSYFDENFFPGKSDDIGALYRLSRNEDGSYSREIVFNPYAKGDTIIQEMAVHELTHDIVASNTAVSKDMFEDVMNYLKQDTEYFDAVRDSVVNAYMQRYAKSDVNVNSPDFQNMIDEELVAKTLQAKLGNQEFINKLHNENRTLFQKFVDWINDKVESFKNRNNAEYKFWKDIQNKFVEAYKNSEFRPGRNSIERNSFTYVDDFNEKDYNRYQPVRIENKKTWASIITTVGKAVENQEIFPGINTIELYDYGDKSYHTYDIYYKDRNNWYVLNDEKVNEEADYGNERYSAGTDTRDEKTGSKDSYNKINNSEVKNKGTMPGDARLSSQNERYTDTSRKTYNKSNGNSQNVESQENGSFIMPKNTKYSINTKGELQNSKGNKVTLEGETGSSDKTLLALHNLDADKLRGVLELGGFPVPSIAITNPDIVSHGEFGDISVVFNKETINPKSKKNEVYDRDVWSPTFPKIEYEANKDAVSNIRNELNIDKNYQELDAIQRRANHELSKEEIERGLNSYGLDSLRSILKDNKYIKYAYLKANNEIEPVMEQVTYNKDVSNDALQKFLDEYPNMADFTKSTPLNELSVEQTEQLSDKIKEIIKEDIESKFKDYGEYKQQLIDILLSKYDNYNKLNNFIYSAVAMNREGKTATEIDEDATFEKVNEILNQDEYNKWIDDRITESLIANKGFDNGKGIFTPQGNRRSFKATHNEINLANLVKAMSRGNTKGGQEVGIFGTGFGRISAQTANKFNSIKDIKNNENRLMTREQATEITQPLSEQLYSNVDELANFYTRKDYNSDTVNHMQGVDTTSEIVEELAGGQLTEERFRRILSEYNSFDVDNIPSDLLNNIIDDLKQVRKLPTDYFEAKPQRAVGFDEIDTVILPKDTDNSLKQQLTDRGIKYIEYDSTNENARADILKSLDEYKFSKTTQDFDEYIANRVGKEGTRTSYKDLGLPGARQILPTTNQQNPQKVEKALNELTQTTQPTQQEPILPPVNNNNIAETNEDGTGKQRRAYKSIIESDYMSDEAKAISNKLIGSDTYIPDSNKAQLQRADERIDRNGITNELATLETNALEGKTIKADDIAVGDRLIQYYSKTGDVDNLERAIRATAMAGTQAGRAVQAFSMLRRQSPNGMAIWIQNSVDKLNSKINGNNKYNFTPEMQQKILNSTEENFETNVEEVLKELGDQVPKSLVGKLDEWRYFSMLANPKTHIRNIIGNLTMGQVQKVKNKVAGAIETATLGTETGRNVLSKIAGRDITEERTHSWKPTSQENRSWAKEFLNDKDINSRLGIGSDKYTPKQGIEKYQRTFKSDALENTLGKMFDINSKLLEVEDNFGLKNAYVTAFADYMDANNLTKATATSKQIAQAQKHAIEEAQRATFHQANSIATAIQTIENKNLATKTFVGAVLPFKKTPMNVAKTGFDYSPAGLLKSITYDTVQLRKGNLDVNTWIDNISQGLTGTGIAVIGYALAEAGILKASGGDDDKEKFEEATGNQNYAIKVGNNTYSLDWLAPTGIPLFIGAELSRIADDTAEKTGKSKNQALNSISNVLDATATAMNPMSEMSMISGLTSALKSYSQGTGQSLAELTANAGKSYVTQFVPTALGQIAKSTDKYERSTTTTESEVGSKAIDSAKNQIMSKIPGLRQLLPVKTDVWGNPVETKGYVENAILPWNRQELQNDKVNQELTRLYDETGDDSVFPATSFNKTLTIDKEKYRMTNQEFQDYKTNYGKKAHSLLSQLIKSDDYKGMTAEQKQTAIEEVYKYAKVTSNSKYATSNDIEYDNSTMNTIKTIKDNGGSEVDYFKYKGITKGMSTEAEKMSAIRNSDFSLGSKKAIYSSTIGADDSKYNVLKNTGINIDTYLDYKSQKFASDETGAKKDKVFEYVNNSPMSYEQRLLTLGMEYSLSDAEQRRIVDIVANMGLTRDEQLQIFSKMKGFKVNGNNVTW